MNPLSLLIRNGTPGWITVMTTLVLLTMLLVVGFALRESMTRRFRLKSMLGWVVGIAALLGFLRWTMQHPFLLPIPLVAPVLLFCLYWLAEAVLERVGWKQRPFDLERYRADRQPEFFDPPATSLAEAHYRHRQQQSRSKWWLKLPKRSKSHERVVRMYRDP